MSKWAFKSNGRFIESFIDIGDDEEWRWTISNHMEVEVLNFHRHNFILLHSGLNYGRVKHCLATHLNFVCNLLQIITYKT